jgi:hypothetical protein
MSSSSSVTEPPVDQSRVAEASHAAASGKKSENLVSTWVNMMDKLLDTLHASYSDDPSSDSYDAEAGPLIATQRSQFQTFVLNSEALQEKSIRAWHDAMMPFYDLCRDRNAEAILKARCWILERIKFEHVWRDPTLDDESRDILWEYVNDLNSYANMYCTMSADLLERVGSIASRAEAAGHTGDLKKMSLKEVIDMSTETWKSLGADDIRDLTSNLPNLFQAVGGTKGMQSMLEQAGGGELMAVFQSAFSYSQGAAGAEGSGSAGSSAPTGDEAAAQPQLNIEQMLSSLTNIFQEGEMGAAMSHMVGSMAGGAPSGVSESKGEE